MSEQNPIREITKHFGQVAMARRIGVGATAVNNAVNRGAFPASWYLVVKEMCDEAGIGCPPEVFGFKMVADAATDK